MLSAAVAGMDARITDKEIASSRDVEGILWFNVLQ